MSSIHPDRVPSLERGKTACLALALLGALAGCGEKVVRYQVQVVTQACTTPLPLEGASHLVFRVTGEGMKAVEASSPVSGTEQQIPEIPTGEARVLEVRAYAGDPSAGGTVVALGRSPPFDVPAEVTEQNREPPSIKVFLRRVNVFTPPSLATSPTTCVRMGSARAAHTATLLDDGRVYVAGGFHEPSGRREALSKAEIFDPVTGGFEEAPDIGVVTGDPAKLTPLPRAFHTATLVNGDQVLLAGGEQQSGGNSATAVATALLYDAPQRMYRGLNLGAARTRHGAAVEAGGRVLILGGIDTFGKLVDTLEMYDPATATIAGVSSSTVSRVGMSVSAAQGGKYIAVAGGADGSALQDEVLLFQFDGKTFVPARAALPRLAEPRKQAAIAPFQDANRLLVIGGYVSPGELKPVASSEILSTTDSFKVTGGPTVSRPRGEMCAALLRDGRVLAVGGRSVDASGKTQSDGSVEVISPTAGAPAVLGMAPLPVPRYFHTCTTLQDGSVLVLGGVREADGKIEVLGDALIFMPAPSD